MNHFTIHQIQLGDCASIKKTFSELDVLSFAYLTLDQNPAHTDPSYAKNSIFKKQVVHGMYVGSLFSAVFGMKLPGLGSIYTKQSLKFTRPVYFGDEIEAKVTVKEIVLDRNRVIFDCVATNQNDEVVIVGEAELMPPREG